MSLEMASRSLRKFSACSACFETRSSRLIFVRPSTSAPISGPKSWSISASVASVSSPTSASVPSTEISVDSDDGVVTLFGVVPTAAVKKAAGAEAAKASGVNRVDNQLEIVPASARKSVDARDADIERALALELKGRVELQRVGVLSKNGIVRLTGSVPSGWDQLTALRVARLSAGVRGVENELQIDDPAAARRY